MTPLTALALLALSLVTPAHAATPPYGLVTIQPANKCSHCLVPVDSPEGVLVRLSECHPTPESGPFWMMNKNVPTPIFLAGRGDHIVPKVYGSHNFNPFNGVTVGTTSIAGYDPAKPVPNAYSWTAVPATTGWLIKLTGTNFCFDNRDGKYESVQIWDCDPNNANQQWSLVDWTRPPL